MSAKELMVEDPWAAIVPKDETLLGTWHVVFINDRQACQERILLLTNKAYYRVSRLGLFPHFKRYWFMDMTHVRLAKMHPSELENYVDMIGVFFSRPLRYLGLLSGEETENEISLQISTVDSTKTYIRVRQQAEDKPSRYSVTEFALRLVTARAYYSNTNYLGNMQWFSSDTSTRNTASFFDVRFTPQVTKNVLDDDLWEFCGSPRPSKKHALITEGNSRDENPKESQDDYDDIDIQSESTILSRQAFCKILQHVPENLLLYTWKIRFDVNVDGASLRHFYHVMSKEKQAPSLLLIQDERKQVFGAFVMDKWRSKLDTSYGAAQSFLFRMSSQLRRSKNGSEKSEPQAKFYNWQETAENNNRCFQLSENDFLAVGCGGAGYGLWVADGLEIGSSNASATFSNEPLAGPYTDFKIIKMEVWCPT